jgi:putative ATP-grasp target RiPP
VPTNTREDDERRPRTEIDDLSELGAELDEGQLAVVAGGQSKDGGSDDTGGACNSCH